VLGDATGELDASFFEPDASATPDKDGTIGMDTDHGATQELDNLLSEFSNEKEATIDIDVDQAAVSGESDSEHSATQVLGYLLDEFNDGFKDDDDEDNKKS